MLTKTYISGCIIIEKVHFQDNLKIITKNNDLKNQDENLNMPKLYWHLLEDRHVLRIYNNIIYDFVS